MCNPTQLKFSLFNGFDFMTAKIVDHVSQAATHNL